MADFLCLSFLKKWPFGLVRLGVLCVASAIKVGAECVPFLVDTFVANFCALV